MFDRFLRKVKKQPDSSENGCFIWFLKNVDVQAKNRAKTVIRDVRDDRQKVNMQIIILQCEHLHSVPKARSVFGTRACTIIVTAVNYFFAVN